MLHTLRTLAPGIGARSESWHTISKAAAAARAEAGEVGAMTELKTLKNIESCCECGGVLIYLEDLRVEAIKWVKAFEKATTHPFIPADDTEKELDKFLTECNGFDPIILWLQHFFNLTTEDDLK